MALELPSIGCPKIKSEDQPPACPWLPWLVGIDYFINSMISTWKAGIKRVWNVSRFRINHIKNMHEENLKVEMDEIARMPLVIQNKRVYKPSYTIEFNREGEVLLYSADPLRNETIYFKYPYILYETLIPLGILNYALNPFDMGWSWCSFGLYGGLMASIPRIWYVSDFKWYPQKLFLLRGGRVIKVDSQGANGDRYTYWIETYMSRPLTQDNMRFDDRDEADFLTEEGQLRYDLTVEFEQFKFFGINTNNQQLWFKTYGTVYHPELFEAAIKGYTIDTTDFVINTADNVRFREGHNNI